VVSISRELQQERISITLISFASFLQLPETTSRNDGRPVLDMASLSPSLHASRSGACIDPQRQAEYPVILGESLRDNPRVKAQFFSLQYNWKPKNISAEQRTVITKTDGQSSRDALYQLTIQEPAGEDKPYKYAGKVNKASEQNGSPTSSPADQTTSLALVFNEEKSAFILEKISAALDFNLTSAPDQSRADIQAYPQITSGNKSEERTGTLRKPTSGSSNDDDDEPDANNPYDYRHFLEEAKANAEKGLGSRTPIPGGLSGLPSPIPTASRFRDGSGPGTPLHKPVTSTPSTQMKKRKISDERAQDSRTGAPTTTHKTTAPKPKPKPTTSSTSSKPKPLSKERISDSDEEIGDTITLSRPAPTSNARKQNNKPPVATNRASYDPSPRIKVDEDADLVIDMGSPPPPVARRRLPGVDSPFAIARTINPGASLQDSPEELEDEEEQDAEGEPDYDLVVMDTGVDADVPMRDVDSDVEDLILGSPAASTTKAASVGMGVGRVDVDVDVDADEDEDDELAAELEAALENDDEDGEQGGGAGGGGGVGLGISTVTGGGGGGAGGEDESEISEEE
jgi:hypothetical protein